MDRRDEFAGPRPSQRNPTAGEDHLRTRRKTVGMAAATEPQKRFLIIRNGRGVLAHGDDMQELESNYLAASQSATEEPADERGGRLVNSWPAFASLARCDHETQTGKVCILDSEEAPDAASSYYGMGFVR